MKVVHIGILFPRKATSATLCGSKSDCRLALLIDSRHSLRFPSGYRTCRRCDALMQKIQPIGKTLHRLMTEVVSP